MELKFEVLKKSKTSKARLGKLHTPHGIINTPAFFPVGTQGTVKAASPADLEAAGVEAILCNTYHLYLRPGEELIKAAGGLHKFINWNKPIITDSGGFQVFSLAPMRKVTDEGVEFTSHIDGSKHFLTPEKVLEIQTAFGSDIMMPLDECAPYPCGKALVKKAMERTISWAEMTKSQILNPKQIPDPKSQTFGIIQGGVYPDLRKQSAEEIVELDFPGYAIGGLSVGEPQEQMFEMVEVVNEILPEEKPRHLFGVGMPQDILGAVKRGVDLFDCVIPTRLARHGSFLTYEGKVSIRLAKFEKDFSPIDAECDCSACKNFTRAYLHHLFWAREILALQMLTVHNLRFYARMMERIRKEILAEAPEE